MPADRRIARAEHQLIVLGPTAAVAAATALATVAEPEGAQDWRAAAVPPAAFGLFLTVATVYVRALRRHRVESRGPRP